MSTGFPVHWFDLVVLAVVVVGVLRGRKRGMSQEFLDLIAWLGLAFGSAYACQAYGGQFARLTTLSPLLASVLLYVGTGVIILVIIYMIKNSLRDKLAGSDFFKGLEYPLGMLSGAIRFLCVLVAILALLNSYEVTEQERAATAKAQKDNFGSISFPTIGEMQVTIFQGSYSGRFLTQKLAFLLIPTSSSAGTNLREQDSIGRQRERTIDQVIGK